MVREGTYRLSRLTAAEFGRLAGEALRRGTAESYIGYEATADVVERLSGYRPEVTRRSTHLEDGDIMLIIRLRQRVQEARAKAEVGREQNDPAAYEFFICEYEATRERR